MGEFYFDDGAFSFSDGTFRLFFHMKEPGGLSNVPLPTFLIEKNMKNMLYFLKIANFQKLKWEIYIIQMENPSGHSNSPICISFLIENTFKLF